MNRLHHLGVARQAANELQRMAEDRYDGPPHERSIDRDGYLAQLREALRRYKATRP